MQMLINGKNADATSGEVINVYNPYNGELLDTIPDASKEDVDHAVACAKLAQKYWAKAPLHERGEILYRFTDLVLAQQKEIASLLSKETGKPIREALEIEIGSIITLFKGSVEKAKHFYGSLIPPGIEAGQEKTIHMVIRQPLGVVACIIPFNYPLFLFAEKVAPALISGNAVIVKPSTDNPLSVIRLCQLLAEAGVPDGVIQVVTGRGSRVGSYLVNNPGVDCISLTGSTEVGIEVAKTAATHLTKTVLELGGNDAFILLEDGDLDLAVEETVVGRMSNSGQTCSASKRFLIQNSVKERFLQKLTARLDKLIIGDPADSKTDMGCLISEKAAITVEEQVKHTVDQGAVVYYGGKRSGTVYYPTILTGVTPQMDVAKDMEIFGPVCPVIGFDSIGEALKIANNSPYGLMSNIITADINKALKAAYELDCGGVVINGSSCFRSCEMPFGGHKKSGIGNEGIYSSLEEFTQTKTIVLKNIMR